MPRKKSPRISRDDTFSTETRAQIKARQLHKGSTEEFSHQNASGSTDYIDALVGRVLFEEGIIVRVTPDREGQIWAKACIRTRAFPRHYLLTSHPAGTPFTTCIEAICRKVEDFQAGLVRPSPDNWH